MSHREVRNQGTGLRDVFDILVKAPPERLQSLTVQLNESPEDNIIHALCLVVLRREAQALNKFQMLRDNRLVNHVTEKLQMGGCNLEDFEDHCGRLEEVTGETLETLARIFKVLSEQRLCDPPLRNLAYQRALSTNDRRTSNYGNMEFDHFLEEAKNVCGPQVVEWISMKDVKSGLYHDLHSNLDEGNATLKVNLCQDQSDRAHSLPSPLQANTLDPSFPSHLEMSILPTVSFQPDKRIPEPSDESRTNTPIVLMGECEATSSPGQSKSNEPALFKAKNDPQIDVASTRGCLRLENHKSPNQNTKPSTDLNFSLHSSTNTFIPDVPVPYDMHDSEAAEEEEEAIFYAFVILHAPEDADMAEKLRERLEAAVGSKGAIFSEEFAVPGKSTLRCVEDAINNSGFTVLLLTRNFNTRMLELKTNSALISSINNKHKYNTVIPLLPRENCMPKKGIPLVLSTIVPLEENERFERKIQKAMSPAKIRKLKHVWTEEQRVNIQKERQDILKQLNQTRSRLIEECKTAECLEKESLRLKNLLLHDGEQHGCDSQARLQQLPNIHIENAQYIMIGNDSQMTVDPGGGADRDDLIKSDKDEEN